MASRALGGNCIGAEKSKMEIPGKMKPWTIVTGPTVKTVGVRKYQGLQILRITAASMVLLMHSTLYAHQRLDQHFRVWGAGQTGVDLFFVLSGFVMVYSSSKLLTDPNGWKIFARRRIIRIVPMYWIATSLKLIVLLFTASYGLHSQFRVANIIDSYLFLPSRNSEGSIVPVLDLGWTLNCEMFFYFLFTLALFFRMNVYRFVGVVLILLAFFGFFRQPDWPAASFYLSTGFLQFFFGLVIARVCQTSKNIPRHFALPLLGLGFLCLIGPWSSANQLHGMGNGLAAALIVYSMASLEDSLSRISGFVLYGADASYVIYLFHPFIAPLAPVAFMKFHLLHPWLCVGCSVFLALAAGCLIHHLIEAPITKWSQIHVLIGSKKSIAR